MTGFNQNASVFAGMSRQALQAALDDAQRALVKLKLGEKVVTVSYAEGEGQRSVHFSSAKEGSLVQMINELKACLGISRHARSGFRFSF